MIEFYANNAQTTIAGAISNTATSVQLSSGAGALFPNPSAGQFFRMTFVDAATGLLREIVFCTARSGDVCTIQRAQEGTAAQNWNAGDIAANFPTAGAMSNLVQGGQAQNGSAVYALDTGTANSYLAAYSPAVTVITDGMILGFKAAHANTGASTFSPNGLTSAPILGAAHSALQGGEIVANGDVWLQYNSSLNGGSGAWVLIDSTGGAMQVSPGTQSNQALNLGQFIGSTSTSGYLEIPALVAGVKRTFIIQWMDVNLSTTPTNFTLPLAFPNAFLKVVGSCTNSAQAIAVGQASLPNNLTQVTASSAASTPGAQIIAIGY